jgi:hypothetical protein
MPVVESAISIRTLGEVFINVYRRIRDETIFRCLCTVAFLVSSSISIPANSTTLSEPRVKAPLVTVVPQPAPVRTPEENLERQVRNMFESASNSDPKYSPFYWIKPTTRVIFVSAKNHISARAYSVEGEEARKALMDLYGPESGVKVVFGEPEIDIEGAFAKATMRFVEQKGGKKSGCTALSIHALREHSVWHFTEIVMAANYDENRCPKP